MLRSNVVVTTQQCNVVVTTQYCGGDYAAKSHYTRKTEIFVSAYCSVLSGMPTCYGASAHSSQVTAAKRKRTGSAHNQFHASLDQKNMPRRTWQSTDGTDQKRGKAATTHTHSLSLVWRGPKWRPANAEALRAPGRARALGKESQEQAKVATDHAAASRFGASQSLGQRQGMDGLEARATLATTPQTTLAKHIVDPMASPLHICPASPKSGWKGSFVPECFCRRKWQRISSDLPQKCVRMR